MSFDHFKACKNLAEVRRVRFHRHKARRVKGFQMFGGCVLSTAKRLVGLGELWRVCFDHHKACERRAERWRVRFDYRKACRRLAVL